MSRVVNWLQFHDQRLFFWFNHKLQHTIMDRIMHVITHLGGATSTIAISLALILLSPAPYHLVGLQCLAALAVSHIPVAILKRKYPRLRPYLVLPKTNICRNPLKDHSFPSGHTTAIFSITIPLMWAYPSLIFILLPITVIVAASRMILGLHYPSDVIAGAFVGTVAAAAAIQFIS
ncbi:phosphatase PAP2 family protein [Marinicrinis sediminis]|uniref:Phosphatase PAP2 family protein n=1 Tax=Marinicrinis sediminis TaxID=1652465 RepID=A0ABW5R7Z2_9BACL